MKLFRTHYETEIRVPYTPAEAFMVYATSAVQELGWPVDYISASGMVAHTTPDERGVSQEVTIRKTKKGFAVRSANRDNSIADWGVNEKIVSQFKDSYSAYQSLPPEEVAYRFEVISPYFASGQDKLEEKYYETTHKKDTIWAIFKPVRGYTATPVILLLNLLVFLLMIASGVDLMKPSSIDLMAWGANYGPAVFSGQVWRLLTAAFIHIGPMHLIMNMAALIYSGAFLEPLIGTKRFTIGYLITAITACLLGLYIHPDTISAGASGAIFGIFGMLLSLLSTKLVPVDIRNRLLFLMGYYVIYNLLYGMKEGIDNAGHIGGLIGGLVIGYLFYKGMKKSAKSGVINIAA